MVIFMKEKLLISACLIGENVKYNGGNNYSEDVKLLKKYFDFIIVCPEVDGGLPIPRVPSERLDNKIINKEGKDVTNEFYNGANKALNLVKSLNIKYALLKEKSPSCGKTSYDGTFTHNLINRPGVLVELLSKENVKLYDESEINILIDELTKN